jgi:hypothetical protein
VFASLVREDVALMESSLNAAVDVHNVLVSSQVKQERVDFGKMLSGGLFGSMRVVEGHVQKERPAVVVLLHGVTPDHFCCVFHEDILQQDLLR